MRTSLTIFFAALLAGTEAAPVSPASWTNTTASAVATAAPLHKAANGTSRITGKYIVKLKSGSTSAHLHKAMNKFQADADHVYNSNSTAFMGFASSLSSAEVTALRTDSSIEYIEEDAVVTTQTTQTNADWGQARLSQAKNGSTTYKYDATAGAGTCAFIIDTGIDTNHTDFGGRATWLVNYAGDGLNKDGHGHGTHVAGTVGSTTFGVAKKTKLFAVKVANSQGVSTTSQVLAGMNYVAANASSQSCPNGVVVNISLGAATSSAINSAAAAIVNAGYFLAVAAGNNAADASTMSPASAPLACTVGATDKYDVFASYSNYGSLVDILAPGTAITSLWPNNMANTLSGTSMASPHIAGLAAYTLGLNTRTKPTAANMCAYLAKAALSGAATSVPSNTVNLIPQSGYTGN